ncbi:MFS transporter [Streptomyces sp. NPDC051173]|uniref:MFS transporter n=1 Tax=Streptomyces sp. NPDC051173 TaxID=3155164 RepID=UPI0034511169
MEYLRLLRKPTVLVLWLARGLSVIGERLYAVAVMWSVYASTGSASLMGLVAVLESAPYVVLGTLGRHLVARFSSCRALAWLDGARAAVTAALPFLWSPDTRGTCVLFAVVLLLGVLGALFDPNLEALVPGLAEEERVHQVTGLFDLTARIALITGRASAGLLLLVFSRIELFVCDGAAFAVSAVALGLLARHGTVMAGRPSAARPSARARPLLRAHPRVGLAIGVYGLLPLCSAATTVGMPVLLATRYGAGAGVYGLLTAAVGVGALIGNPLAGHWRPTGWFAVCCGAWAVDGVATACIGLVGRVSALGLLSALTGLVAPVAAVSLRARLGRFPPTERVRLMAVEHTATRLGGMAGIALLPLVIRVSPRGSFLMAGATVAVLAAGVHALSTRLPRTAPAPGAAEGGGTAVAGY